MDAWAVGRAMDRYFSGEAFDADPEMRKILYWGWVEGKNIPRMIEEGIRCGRIWLLPNPAADCPGAVEQDA